VDRSFSIISRGYRWFFVPNQNLTKLLGTKNHIDVEQQQARKIYLATMN